MQFEAGLATASAAPASQSPADCYSKVAYRIVLQGYESPTEACAASCY